MSGGYGMSELRIYTLKKELILATVCYLYRTVSKYCKEAGISRTRFYKILNREYVGKNSKAVEKLRSDLGLPAGVIWEQER